MGRMRRTKDYKETQCSLVCRGEETVTSTDKVKALRKARGQECLFWAMEAGIDA